MKRLSLTSMVLMLALVMMLPGTSYALDLETCNTNLGATFQQWQYTSKVVSCLRGTIIQTVLDPNNGFLIKLSDFMKPTVAIIAALAVAIFGIRITGGEPNLQPKAIGFLLRLGLVWMFAYNLGGLGQAAFDIMDDLVCVVSIPQVGTAITTQGETFNTFAGGVLSNCYPWNFIDQFVGRLFGFGQNLVLFHGLLGLIASSLFSSTIGILLFITGAMALLDIIFLLLRVIFIYLSSVLAVAFMLIISPLIIPTAMFYTTERYFKRWLDILITGLLIPMMMFAFVGMFMGIFDILIDRIINVLGGVDAQGKTHFEAFWRLNQPKMTSWMMPADPNLTRNIENLTDATAIGTPAIQSFINPTGKRAVDMALFVAPGVDFGEAGVKILQQLVYAFISLWIFSSLMKSMINKIPEITQSIVGASLGIRYEATGLETGIKKALSSDRGSGNLMDTLGGSRMRR